MVTHGCTALHSKPSELLKTANCGDTPFTHNITRQAGSEFAYGSKSVLDEATQIHLVHAGRPLGTAPKKHRLPEMAENDV